MSKDLIKKILDACNVIHQSSIKGSGNFIITSPQAAKSFGAGWYRGKLICVGERIEKCNKILDKIKNGKTN